MARYQRGNLSLKKRAKLPDCWEFRWRDADQIQHSRLLGSVKKLPTERDAQRAADAIRLEINSELPQSSSHYRGNADRSLPVGPNRKRSFSVCNAQQLF